MNQREGLEVSMKEYCGGVQYTARNFAAVKFVTKASQWCKIEMKRRRKVRGAQYIHSISFAVKAERQSFIFQNLNESNCLLNSYSVTHSARAHRPTTRQHKRPAPPPRACRGATHSSSFEAPRRTPESETMYAICGPGPERYGPRSHL
ncbi:hypothetical protein EVAR_68080_1 [Eumeta japonica]|uniref:Uncharacterized protein n=1 Tax=Eumeta variegata TaxID=151549 RepID=A0A4C1ZKG3_EUMVA|nr:hypothetical protein EVAR_68080_1 [Eumeta japonica]